MRCFCQHSVAPLSIFAFVVFILLRSSWAASECQIELVARPDPYNYVFTTFSISCQGEQVVFRIPGGDYGDYTNVTGSAVVAADSAPNDGIDLVSGEDVTFTSVLVRNYDYINSYALSILNCKQCSLQNAVFDTVTFSQGALGGIPLLIRNSSVALNDALFTNLGWLDASAGGSRGAVLAVDSEVMLQNTSFTNIKLSSQSAAALSMDGGLLNAQGCSWQNLTLDANHGCVLAASSGAHVALQGCNMSGVIGGVALLGLGSGASLDLAPDNGLYLPHNGRTGAVLVADRAGAIWWPDERILRTGSPEDPQPAPPEVLWRRGAVVLVGQDPATPLLLGNVGVRLKGGGAVDLADMSLLWLDVLEGSQATVRNVSFAGLSGWQRPALQFTDSSGWVSGCTFRGVSVFDDDFPAAVILDAVNSDVNVTDCIFDQIAWSASGSWPSGPSQESQVVRAALGGTLRVGNSSFSGIGGCGTAVRAASGATVVLEGVNITNIDLSGSTGERRAAVVVADGALDARQCRWSRINVSDSTSGAALDAGSSAAVTLRGCNFTDISAPQSPAVQLLAPVGAVSVEGCIWRDVVASYALRLGNVADQSVVINRTEFSRCRCGSQVNEFRAPVGLANCTGAQPVLLSRLDFSDNTGRTGGGVLVSQCHVTVADSTFRNNSAGLHGGGAIYAQEGSALDMSGCVFISNRADGGLGGAVYSSLNSSLVVRGCTFVSNSAARGKGGALAVLGGVLTVADDSTFTRNAAGSGGAVFCSGSDALLSSSTFFANSAQMYGGAVFTAPGGVVTLRDSVLTGNTAAHGGALCGSCGAASASAGAEVAASRIGFSTGTDAVSRASLLRATEEAFNSSALRIDGSTFATNACAGATESGGAVHIGGGRAFVRGSSFVGNTCPNGGALAVVMTQPGDWLAVTHSSFRSNYGASRGGAVCLLDAYETALYAFFFDNTFRANNARLFGGALDARMGWAVDLLDNSFVSNGNGETGLNGGAVFLANCRNLNTDKADVTNIVSLRNSFKGNTGGRGGAVSSSACNISSLEDRYVGNRATGGGGAIMAINTEQIPLSTLQLTDVYAESNYAKASGGAILINQQGVSILNSVFINNSADIAGGALAAMESSPSALLVLQRNDNPYYSEAEYSFLRAVVMGTKFDGNLASTGGGAIYSDSSRLHVKECTFLNNVAGDDIPNDEWSDSGGAISAAACFGLSEVHRSNFTGNRASGGPGGAIVQTACSFLLAKSNFDCNTGSTFGGAVAAGNRRTENSTSSLTPSLTVLSCNFTGNQAQLHDGGALLGRDMNASAFVSEFRKNTAGRNGGAVAFLNNIGSSLRACTLESNRAVQYGGAAYAVTNSLLSVQDSDFRDNYALLNGGALSSIGSTCVLMARSTFAGNYAGVSGGALQLQPTASAASPSGSAITTATTTITTSYDSSDAELAAASRTASGGGGTCVAVFPTDNDLQDDDAVPCISQFLRQVDALASRRGLELLGLVEAAPRSYNATLVHADGAGGSGGGSSYFGRGGVLLPTPRVAGPAQFFGYDLTVIPQPPSVVELARGSSLALADWSRLRLEADASGTALFFGADRLDVQVEGAVVQLARGSALTRLTADMVMLPAGTDAYLRGDTLFVGPDLVPYTPSSSLPVLSSVLSYRAAVASAGGAGAGGSAIRVADWNRWVLRAIWGAGSILLDAFTGAAVSMSGGAQVTVANGSPLIGHSANASALAPGSFNVTVLRGGIWQLGNGTRLETGGSRPAVSVVPAANSSIELASGSHLSVASWLPYTIHFRPQSGVARLDCLPCGSGVELAAGVVVSLPAGSVILTPPSDLALLPRGTALHIQGANWATGSTAASGGPPVVLSPGSGNVAMGVVLPPGSTAAAADGRTLIAVRDWNRYVMWAGPMGTTIVYDTDRGSTLTLADMSTVVISRGTPFARYDGSTVLSTGQVLTIGATDWTLDTASATTTISLTDSTIALTAILAKGCRIKLANGTLSALPDWYRYLLVTIRAGTYLYDTASDASTPLGEGTRVEVAKGSALLLHDSFAAILTADSRLAVREAGLALGNVPITESLEQGQVVILPADGSRLSYDDGPGWMLQLDGVDVASRYVPWVGVNRSYLYDSALLATFELAPGSTLRLAPTSSLAVHDSGTTVLASETNLTASAGGTWSLSNGLQLAVDGATTGLSASPTGSSRILYDNASWSFNVFDRQRYSLQAGLNGTTLYDARADVSYLLADGSRLALDADSLSYVRNGVAKPYGAPTSLTVQSGGGAWLMGDGTVAHPGDGVGSSDEFEAYLHTGTADRLPDELGRLCSVDLTTATYAADPYAYNADAAAAYLRNLTKPDDFTHSSLYANFARLAYGFGADVDVSGYNASLLLPPVPVSWDPLGRPSSAVVTCSVATAPEPAARARGVSMLLIDLTLVNNTAGSAGGGIYFDGGRGSVLIDACRLDSNTVLNGDGGGLGLFQSDDQRDMRLQVYVVSSRFTANMASAGTGGAVSLRANKIHQQVIFLNTTLDGNLASSGGGLAVSKRVSVLLNESLVENNRADVAAVAGAAASSSESLNFGNGGGIMASSCNELQLTSGSRLLNNIATGRGGGLAAYACALVLLNDTTVEANVAQSGGGVYTWNDLPATASASLARDSDVGASIAVVVRSTILNNTAVDGNVTDDQLEGFGGGFLLRGRVSTLLADSYFEDNTADSQGGSIFIESTCDLSANSTFLVTKMEAPTAFESAAGALLPGTVANLQWPRPKGCWGTVVYLPRFYNNEAARSGGALFASHPEALSLVCDENAGSGARSEPVLNYMAFNESALAGQVLLAMKKASYQVLDNRIVQSCYRDEIQRIYNRSLDQLRLSGTELSTLDISNNRALGYGYLIAIVPSKLQALSVTWSGNTSNVAVNDTTASDAQQATWRQQRQQQQQQQRRLMASVSGSDSSGAPEEGSLPVRFMQLQSLADQPLFSVTTGSVYDKDTQQDREVLNYHITTYSNKPMDIPILLLDALDQIASENTTLRQAQVRARLTEASNGCKAELLGGYEGTARNGTATMAGMRLRALKGANYSIEFRVEDAIIQGTVEPMLINVTVPPCSIGEVPRDDGYLCQKCDQRSFSLWQDTEPLVNCTYPDLRDIICYPCPDGAECLGGAVMVPRQGFWHSAANSTFMNACPNSQACRDDDDDAQDLLVGCQEWWYSRPQGFDYQAFVDSVLAADWSEGLDTAAPPGLNVSDPRLCALWGLPYNHPASYMQKQCAEGYQGHLCAVCAPVDGHLYASSGDFECQQCFSRGLSTAIAVLGFVANVVTVLATILVTFMTDYTEEEELGVGDILKVLIVHMQFFVIVTRLNIEWPTSISFITSLLSAFTGAVSKVYAPSCLLDVSASPDDYATVDQLAAIITPLLTTLCVAALWMIIRLILFNFNNPHQTEEKLDMRTISEYKADRARRFAEKKKIREAAVLREDPTEDSMRSPTLSYGTYGLDAYTDLRASELVPGAGGSGGDRADAGFGRTAVADLSMILSPPTEGMARGVDPVADPAAVHVGLALQEATGEKGAEAAAEAGPEKEVLPDTPGLARQRSAAFSERRSKAFLPLPPRESDLLSGPTPRRVSGPGLPPPAHPLPLGDTPTPRSTDAADGVPGTSAWHSPTGSGAPPIAITTTTTTRATLSSAGQGSPSNPLAPQPPQEQAHAFPPSPFSTLTSQAAAGPCTAMPPLPPPPPRWSPVNSRRVLPTRVSVDGGTAATVAAAAATANSIAAATSPPQQLSGLPISPVSSVAAPLPGTMHGDKAAFEGQVLSPGGGALMWVEGPDGGAANPAPRPNNGRTTPDTDVVRPVVPRPSSDPLVSDNSREAADCDPRRGDPPTGAHGGHPADGCGRTSGAGGAGSGPGHQGSTRKGGGGGSGNSGCGGGGSSGSGNAGDGRKSSSFLRRKLTQGSKWFRTFFTYDEEAAAEEGQVRWASLANIHRTMAWWRQILLVVMIACFVLYPAWAQATLQIFACYYLDDGTGYYSEFQLAQWGKGYWILNMNQECYLGDHARIWVPIGIVCIFVICVGIPFLTLMVTWTHRTALRTVHVAQTYGFLYQRYDYETFYWWEAAMQAQTLMLVVVDVFGRVLVVYQQAVLLMLALMAIMWSNMYFQPLKHKLLERMSSLSLAVLSFTVALGLFFVPPADRKDPVTGAVGSAIGALIVAMNAALLVYFVLIMWTQGREAINRNVAAARQRVLTATSRVQLGITAVRHHVSSASQNLRTVTSRSLSMVWDKVHVRRWTSNATPPITPRP